MKKCIVISLKINGDYFEIVIAYLREWAHNSPCQLSIKAKENKTNECILTANCFAICQIFLAKVCL